MTAHGDIPMSVRAMKDGAMDFMIKPFRDQDLLDAVQQALERDRAAAMKSVRPRSSGIASRCSRRASVRCWRG